MPESFALAVAGAAIRTAVMSKPQALIVLFWLDMGASRRLWTGCYAYFLVCSHAQLLLVQLCEDQFHGCGSQFLNSRLKGAESLERCDCVLCEFNFIIICYLVNIRLIRCAPA